jgi:DNA-binding IclR family transcriptional regulator
MGNVVGSLDRGLQILEMLGESAHPLGATAVGEQLGVDRSTAYRLLRTLEARHFVHQRGSGGYQLGSKCIELGNLAMELMDVRTRARSFLQEMADRSGYTVHLAVLTDNRPIYVDKVQGKSILTVSTVIGREAPLHCTASGKCLAAFSPPDLLRQTYGDEELPRYTKNTCTDLASLEEELQMVRTSGYAMDNEERHEGVRCVGAPIFDHSGKVVGSISISGPSSEITDSDIAALEAMVVDATSRLSAQLGYTGDGRERYPVSRAAT